MATTSNIATQHSANTSDEGFEARRRPGNRNNGNLNFKGYFSYNNGKEGSASHHRVPKTKRCAPTPCNSPIADGHLGKMALDLADFPTHTWGTDFKVAGDCKLPNSVFRPLIYPQI